MNWRSPFTLYSLMAAVLAFGLDRAHKAVQVSTQCIAIGAAPCIEIPGFFAPLSMTDWRGGEVVQVTPFFDYVLVWNTGISYGLFGSLPVWGLGVVMLAAILALSVWWWRASNGLTRLGLAFCIGGALSNALDRLLYGAVADFFHLHAGTWSFYIFNIADMAITLGVVLLLIDLIGWGKSKPAPQPR